MASLLIFPALLLAWFFGRRYHRSLRRQQALEAERTAAEESSRSNQRLLDEARQASRRKSEFLASMSHEIRTPMNGVLGMISLALMTELSPEQRDYLETSKTAAEGLLALLNDILDISKIEADRLELDPIDFSLCGCVSQAIKSLYFRARQKGLDLTLSRSADAPDALVGDPLRLRQVVLNLVGNAIKFTDSGRVEVEVWQESQTEREVTLHFRVSDSGIGIPAEKHATIFEAFRQAELSTARRYGGSGLGLAICSKLVALMGGRIWVESEVGRGSAFHFTAQFGITESAPQPVPEPAATIRAQRPRRVLLAEDNPVNQKLAVRLLEKMGHQVAVASTGLQALAMLDQEPAELILMDVQMPEMDGVEATTMIRRREALTGEHIPILAMTAHTMKGDREKFLAAGMDGYVAKPVRLGELAAAIAALDGPARAASKPEASKEGP